MHTPTRNINDAGLLGLEREIAQTSTADLAEQITLLIELPPTMQAATWPRLRLAAWELRRRVAASETAVAA